MKLDIICNDGSPLGVVLDDLHGKNGRIGVGGAEAALLTLCEAWAKRGDDVTLYNNPIGSNDVFRQLPIDNFREGADRDVLIVFRSPNTRAYRANGKKIWFSTDQYTIGDFKFFSGVVDEIVTISPFHNKYFKDVYNIDNTTTIDLPVRTWEYEQDVERIPNRLLFCSVPDRGLDILAQVWDKIHLALSDTTLTITSDYRLWGSSYAGTEKFMMRFARKDGVEFLGAVKRDELIKFQLQSDIMAYPCTYDELFCIACAECQVAGAYPITSGVGALVTTNMASIISGNPQDSHWQDMFVETIIDLLSRPEELKARREYNQKLAKERFDINRILGEWDKVFNG